jgi:hypothetical protein
MTQNMVVYVCASAGKAAQAQAVLIRQGFPAAQITAEKVDVFAYDAETYNGSGSDSAETSWVVIGRK